MLRWLVLAVALSASLAEEEPQASASPDPILVQNDHFHRVEEHRLRDGLARLRGDLHRIRDRIRDHRHRVDPHRDDRHHNDRHRDDRHHNDRHHDDRHHDDRHRDSSDDGQWWERRDERYDHEDPEGPVILRSIRPDEHGRHTPDIARQNKIIADVYSPDYAEPTWVLDYRYLKTGGRDYTRGPGGQIIILPKGISTNENKEFKNYDELIEHLRLKNLAERKKPQYFMPLGEGAQEDDHEELGAQRKQEEEDWWKHH